jgi:hypothetical protein
VAFPLQTEAARLADDLDRTSKLLASTESALASEKEEITRLYGSMQVCGSHVIWSILTLDLSRCAWFHAGVRAIILLQ